MRSIYFQIIFLIILSVSKGYAQSISRDGEILSTQATNPNARPDAKKQGLKKKKIRYIISSDTKGTLAGNKCFEEATRKFGFEYLIVPEKLPPNRNGFSRFMHNLGVKTVLFFKNGPCWQIRLKNKYKQCRYQYGDFVG
jgi:hypothetical protein